MVSAYSTWKDHRIFEVEREVLRDLQLAHVKFARVDKEPILLLPGDYGDFDKYIRTASLPPGSIVNYLINMDKMVLKCELAKTLYKHYVNPHLIIPVTYTDFNKVPMSSDHQLWVLKEEVQQQKGLRLVRGNPLNFVKPETTVIQHFLDDPLIFRDYKVNFRVYILAIRRREWPEARFYMCNTGFVYYARGWVTTGYGKRNIYDTHPLTWPELLNQLPTEHSAVISDNMLQTFKLAVQPYRNLLQTKQDCGFQLFGADVQPERNGHVHLLEFNLSPDLNRKSDADGAVKLKVVRGMYDLVLSGISNNYIHLQ